MKTHRLLISALLVSTAFGAGVARDGAIAQTAPAPAADTAQSSFWVPVARVNPAQPIQVRLVNRAGIPIEYGLTTNEAAPRRLEAGATETLGSVPVPAYMLINPLISQANLSYDISVANNVVTVEVLRISPNIAGASTFNIDPAGGIYVY